MVAASLSFLGSPYSVFSSCSAKNKIPLIKIGKQDAHWAKELISCKYFWQLVHVQFSIQKKVGSRWVSHQHAILPLLSAQFEAFLQYFHVVDKPLSWRNAMLEYMALLLSEDYLFLWHTSSAEGKFNLISFSDSIWLQSFLLHIVQ